MGWRVFVRLAGSAVWVFVVLGAIGSGADPMMEKKVGPTEVDHAHHETKVIGILASGLAPSIQVVPVDAAFGWLNYSASTARIRFTGDVVDKMFCRSPGRFRVEAEKLEAPEVPSGAYATLCSLRPGDYEYEVYLEEGEAPLVGRIVVPGL